MSDYQQIVSVILAIRCQGRFLLAKRSEDDEIFPGYWQNMGGKVEIGEKVEDAIKRELKEEVGLSLESFPIFLHSYSWKKDDDSPTRLGLIFLIELKNKNKDYKINLSSELSDFGWFTIEEAVELKTIGASHPTGTLGQLKQAINYFK